MPFDYDLFVIGAGSGGVRASRISAGYGARVAVAEERYLGGTCVNVGCIPKKLLVYASHFADDFEDAAGFGWELGPRSFSWSRLIENKDKEIARLNDVHARMLDQAGVTRIEGTARLLGPNEVEVAGQRIRAEHIVVAVGSWPYLPEIPGCELAISSNEAFHLKEMPERVVVVGGGYIAVEFAGIFHGLGAQVTQLYRGPLFLRGFDEDLRTTLAEEMRKRGMDLRFDSDPREIERLPNGALQVRLHSGECIETDAVLYATGRVPKTAGLGLEEAGVALGPKNEVLVDAYSRTSVPSIWALGDVTDRLNLTPMAIAEAMAFARTVFGGEPTTPDHSGVPTAVFSQPNLGTVGLSEAEAREQHDVEIYRSRFRALKHTLSGRQEQTLMKLVVDRPSGRVLGCHMLGPEAGEIIQGLAVAMKCGATKAQFDATVGIHPTSAEEFVTMREPVAE
jgi:glutathione reductase (NADPH)